MTETLFTSRALALGSVNETDALTDGPENDPDRLVPIPVISPGGRHIAATVLAEPQL